MTKHIKYPSINQYRNVIKSVIDKSHYVGRDEYDNPIFDRTRPLPILTFKGTPKIHGTNSSVVIWPDRSVTVQSRNRVLSEGSDNAGFYNFVSSQDGILTLKNLVEDIKIEEPITIYGEWCGEGIMKGVAISELPKMFIIFDVCYGNDDARTWFNISSKITEQENKKGIYSINQFESYELDIDFRNPQLHQNELVYITEQVEAECPVGKFFGVSGIGEGVVWKCITEGYEDSKFWFKVKGEKHSVSKVKTLAEVDVEKLKTIEEFGDRVLTKNRLIRFKID